MSSVLGVYISGTQDPTVVATYGEIGWLYVKLGATPKVYQKITTNGSDTNWSVNGNYNLPPGTAGNIPYYNPAGNDLDNQNLLKFDPVNQFLGINQATPQARIHAHASVTAGVVGSNAFILGQIDPLENVGDYSLIVGGEFFPNICTDKNSIVAGEGNVSRFPANAVFGNVNVLGVGVGWSLVAGGAHIVDGSGVNAGFNLVTGSVNFVQSGGSNAVMGFLNVINGDLNMTHGETTIVTGNYNIASGLTNSITGDKSFIIGESNIISANSNHIVGGFQNSVLTSGSDNLVAGQNNVLTSASDCIVAGDGNAITSRSRTLIVGISNIGNANNCLIGGNNQNVTGENSVVGGINQIVSGDNAVVGGNDNTVSGTSSGAVGSTNIVAAGNSFALGGNNNLAVGFGNLSWGSGNEIITNGNSNAVGGENNSIDDSGKSIVIGDTNTLNTSSNTVVSGSNNVVTGVFGSNVSGNANTVVGSSSLVSGDTNAVNHDNVLACGDNLASDRTSQGLVGSWNAADADAQFTVGIGTGAGDKKNALVVGNSGLVKMTQGGLRTKLRAVAAGPDAVSATTDKNILINAVGLTFNLPAGVEGQEFYFKDITGNANPNATINRNGADTFEGGGTSVTINVPYRSMKFLFYSGVWYTMAIA